jgi:hypothetical protein
MAYRFGPFVYDPVSRGLLHRGVEIALTHTRAVSSEFRPGEVKGSAAKAEPRGASRLSVYYRQKRGNGFRFHGIK